MKALIIIDMQYDFLPDGSLAVKDGDQIIPVINRIMNDFDLVVATQDWHPANHKSFATQHAKAKAFDIIDWQGQKQILWPNHCVQDTHGAEITKAIHLGPISAIFRKGMNPELDSYSAFFDNNHLNNTGLSGFLKDKNITEVYFCGLAADYCVLYSALDAIKEGFESFIIENATQAIDPNHFEIQKESIKKQGIHFLEL